MNKLLACVLLLAASGCPDVKTDPGEGPGLPSVDGPTVEFDPANSIIPFPNNLVLDPTTGKVNIPAPACESPVSQAIRTGVLNTLDGFGTFEAAMQVTFTDPVDSTTLTGNIVMYQRAKGATATDPASAVAVPIQLVAGTTLRFSADACSTPATIDAVTIIPMVPLDEKSTYTVAVLDGVKTADGKDFLPSFTWALVRQTIDPVTVDAMGNIVSESTPLDPTGDANHNGIPDAQELLQLDQLWKAEATGLAFLDGTGAVADRSKILVAWDMTTQTTSDPIDPSVTGSLAAALSTGTLLGTQSQVNGSTTGVRPSGGATETFLEDELVAGGLATSATAAATCTALNCNGIGDVLGAALTTSNYETHVPNPLAGGGDVPGAWSDPLKPMIQSGFPDLGRPSIPTGAVEVLIFVPAGLPPAGGYPVVVFGHGLGSYKETLIAIAGTLGSLGIASVAIDFVNSGSRAIRISDDPTIGCGPGICSVTTSQTCYADTPIGTPCPGAETCINAPSYATTNQCYAPFLSTDLAGTRDNFRQTILDLQRLVLATKACGSGEPSSCGDLAVDPTKLQYLGISLGGIIGSTTTSLAQDLKGGVLNVPGVGLVDILENSETFEIKCPLVDALITAGVLQGAQWNGMDGTMGTGLCTTDAWKTQPGYAQFASTARWVLDPADGANYVSTRLPAKKFLMQEVVGDLVVPNVATDDEGALVGLTPGTADPINPQDPTTSNPSVALLNAATTSQWLRYPTLDATVASTGGFGNAFQHASLLEPVVSAGHCLDTPSTTCVQNSECTVTAQDQCVFPGVLGTERVQTDAAYFLHSNE